MEPAMNARDRAASGGRPGMPPRRRARSPGSHATIGPWLGISSGRSARRGSSTRSARRSAATAARSRASGPTTSRRSSIGAIVERTGIDPAAIEDVILGCANQAGEDNRNVARMAALLAGLPVEVAGQTVNRLCGSGLQAVNSAAPRDRRGRRRRVHRRRRRVHDPRAVRDAQAGRPPWTAGRARMEDTTLGWRFVNPRMRQVYPPISLGETAESVAEQWTVVTASARTRSRSRASGGPSRRSRPGGSTTQLVPVDGLRAQGRRHRRRSRRAPAAGHHGRGAGDAQAGVQAPAAPSPPATAPGSTTARRRCCSSRPTRARELGLRPMARIVVDGRRRGPPGRDGHRARARRSRKALDRAGLDGADLDVVELNEAFASQAVACMDELGLDPAQRQPERRRDRARAPARGVAARGCSRCSSTSCGAPAAATGWRRCASAWARGSRRSSSASRAELGSRIGAGPSGCWTKPVAVRTIGLSPSRSGHGTQRPEECSRDDRRHSRPSSPCPMPPPPSCAS